MGGCRQVWFLDFCDLVISYTNATSALTIGSDSVDGLAAAIAYQSKIDAYSKLYTIHPIKSFVPISMETGGRMHKDSKTYLQTLCCRLIGGDPKNWTKNDQSRYTYSIRNLMDSVSLALAKSVARSLIDFPPSKVVEVGAAPDGAAALG